MDSHYLTTRHRSRKSSADGSVTPSFEVENSFAAQMAQYSDNEAATDEKDAMLFSSTSADASPLRRSSGPLDSRAGRRWMRVAVLAAVLAVVTLFRHTWWNAPAYAKAIVPTETLKGDGTRWVVLTTINYPTDSVRTLAAINYLNVVVVGDTKTPKDWLLPGVHFLSVERQRAINYKIHGNMPYRHYARKNLGFLFAISNGARIIYGTDDDNELIDGLERFDLTEHVEPPVTWELVSPHLQLSANESSTRNVCNPYAVFGQPSVWPRGYPLQNMAAPPCTRFRKAPVQSLIQQGLANGDPDVDAIFRLTRKDDRKDIRIEFNDHIPHVAYPYGMFSPFNSQNTLFRYAALPLTYIPYTTTFRVCDIWRGYWAQRLLWEIGGQLTFTAPSVNQFRNAHDYLDDYLDERDLYEQAHKLIDFLSAWRSEQPTFLERIKHLATDMAAAKFWHGDEATAIERWVEDLRAIGYVEAPLYDWESDMNQALLIAASGESWYTPNTETRSERNHGLQLPIFNYSPAQRQSTYLSDSVRPAQLAPLPAANDNLEGCPFSDIEAHLATIWASRDMFANLIDSWLGAMPCFPKLHVAVPAHEISLFEKWLPERGIHNFRVWDEAVPETVKTAHNAKNQWTDFIMDSYSATAPYLLALDVDVFYAMPTSCNRHFDDDGKPYLFHVDNHLHWFPMTHTILRDAAKNFPERWPFTIADIDRLTAIRRDYMVFFPTFWPRYMFKTMRDVMIDAAGGGIEFADAIRVLTDQYSEVSLLSQFDILGWLADLMYSDVFHIIALTNSDDAFNPANVGIYGEGYDASLPAVHLTYPQYFYLDGNFTGTADWPDPEFVKYTKTHARHLICTRDATPTPVNDIDTDTLFVDILSEEERDCTAEPGLNRPWREVRVYSDEKSTVKYDPERWLAEYERNTHAKRALCTDPLPKVGRKW